MSVSKSIITIYQIFFIGLLLQFFAFNVATFSRWLDAEWMKLVWLRKEALLGLLLLLTAILIIIKGQWKQIIANKFITFLLIVLLLGIWITAYQHTAIHQLDRWIYALAFKYDFLWFIILFAGFHSAYFVDTQTRSHLIRRYGKVIKYCLLWALIRYLITFIKPGFLKLFWYNNFIFEGTAWGEAPAVYYTHINQGLPRNSFLFERPTTWWFYLIAFFPLFYSLFLHQKPIKYTRARRGIYALNILLTFSRAARGAWIIQLVLLWFITRGKNKAELKAFLLKALVPFLIIIGLVGFFGYKQIFAREYSNTGHIAMMKKWIDMSIEKPLHGRWAATAGPWSHRNPEKEGFNPENQFLQIFIEYGVVWFLPWMILFVSLNLIWAITYWRNDRILDTHTWKNDAEKYGDSPVTLLMALSLWLIWLSASGMILHSFVDRMVVYPFMLLFGIILAHFYQKHEISN